LFTAVVGTIEETDMTTIGKSGGPVGTSLRRAALVFIAALVAALTVSVRVPLADPASPMTITNVDSPDPVVSGRS